MKGWVPTELQFLQSEEYFKALAAAELVPEESEVSFGVAEPAPVLVDSEVQELRNKRNVKHGKFRMVTCTHYAPRYQAERELVPRSLGRFRSLHYLFGAFGHRRGGFDFQTA